VSADGADRVASSPEATDAARKITKGRTAAGGKARKPRVVEPGGPEDLEFHLQRVAAVWPTTISQRSIERLARLLGGDWEK
jgi:hypothetical protein